MFSASQTCWEKACSTTAAQILYFVWLLHIHAGHLCKWYPCVSFLMHPQGWPQQHSLQAFFSCLKKMSWLEKKEYLMSTCALAGGAETWGKERGDAGGGQRLWHYVAWNIFSCLIHETQSPPRVTMAAAFSHLYITPHSVVPIWVWRKMIDSLTQANHLCACLLCALSSWISLYGRCSFLPARSTQLFCLSPHTVCSLSFSFWPFAIDSEAPLGSFSCLVIRCNLVPSPCAHYGGLRGVRCTNQIWVERCQPTEKFTEFSAPILDSLED